MSPLPPILRHPPSETEALEAVSGHRADGDYTLNSLVVNSVVETRGDSGQEHATRDGSNVKGTASGMVLDGGAAVRRKEEERGRVPASIPNIANVCRLEEEEEEGAASGGPVHRRYVDGERRHTASDKRRDAAYAGVRGVLRGSPLCR